MENIKLKYVPLQWLDSCQAGVYLKFTIWELVTQHRSFMALPSIIHKWQVKATLFLPYFSLISFKVFVCVGKINQKVYFYFTVHDVQFKRCYRFVLWHRHSPIVWWLKIARKQLKHMLYWSLTYIALLWYFFCTAALYSYLFNIHLFCFAYYLMM